MTNSYEYADEDMAYVASDGNYGGGTIIVYNPSDLTEDQHLYMQEMHDSVRLEYVQAILDGNEEVVEYWEATVD